MLKQYESSILELLYAITEPLELEGLSGPMERFVERLGYGGYAFGLVWGEEGLDQGRAGLVGGNLVAVVPAYLDANLTARDPVVQRLRTSREALLWSPFLRRAAQSDDSGSLHEIRALLGANGISTGATIPVDLAAAGCRAALAISAAPDMDMDGFDERFRENGWLLRLAALSLGQRLGCDLIAKVGSSLSSSERLVLKALSLGMRPREIAEKLGKSEHTIRNQIVSAQQRLDASTKEQAIARALKFGLLTD